MAAVIRHLDDLESGLCLRINSVSKSVAMRRLFAIVSRLGDGGFWLAMGGLLFAMHGTAALPAMARMALTAVLGVLIYKILKEVLVRERPFITHAGIECGTAPLDRYSFPSGHTLHAVSLTIMLGHVEPALLIVTLPFVILVAMSRVVLGLHYPSDVLAGALIGAVLGASSAG